MSGGKQTLPTMCAKWHLSYRNSDLDEDGRGITVIRARGLTKIFNTRRGREMIPVTTVDHIDLDVAEGEVIGFLGPNGAGKTTTLRMLTTLLQPTSGEAKVAGHDISTNPRDVRRRIGYVSQGGSTSSFARVGDEIVDHAMLYGLDAGTARVRAQELLERLDLPGVWTRTPRTLSGGQRRRLNLAMGLVHHPKLAFLDEPTAGLDPQARANLWSHIADMRRHRSCQGRSGARDDVRDPRSLLGIGCRDCQQFTRTQIGAHPTRIEDAVRHLEPEAMSLLLHRGDDEACAEAPGGRQNEKESRETDDGDDQGRGVRSLHRTVDDHTDGDRHRRLGQLVQTDQNRADGERTTVTDEDTSQNRSTAVIATIRLVRVDGHTRGGRTHGTPSIDGSDKVEYRDK
jgi:ABC-type Na+ transport system ATPase subunit NatA